MVPNEVIYQDKCPLLNSDEATNILCNKMNNELIHSTHQAKNDRNSGVWQSGISKSLAEYVQHRVLCQCTVVYA